MSFRPAKGACRSVDVGRPAGALACAADGGVVLAVAGGFARLDWNRAVSTCWPRSKETVRRTA
jgi:hypothetical protein